MSRQPDLSPEEIRAVVGDPAPDFLPPDSAALRGRHVVLGLSGGVDSSVSAALLKAAGLEVTALFMKNWEEDDATGACGAAADLADARAVADRLGIELRTINFSREYWDRVFGIFLSEYAAGRTPNPDILCNQEIKFRAFLDYAVDYLQADYIATGHYCRRSFGDTPVRLLRGADPGKDQSYFLCAIKPEALERTLFPVGGLMKSRVREIAAALNLITATKKDSTGICFIGERHFQEFLHRFLPQGEGPIVSVEGVELGRHHGLMSATIGQRKGLGIGGQKDGSGDPWFVVDKDLRHNTLIVAQGARHPARFAQGLITRAPDFITAPAALPCRCTVKIRYRQPDRGCTIYPMADHCLKVVFDEPQTAVAPGQSAVFYDGPTCLGGAVIESALKEV